MSDELRKQNQTLRAANEAKEKELVRLRADIARLQGDAVAISNMLRNPKSIVVAVSEIVAYATHASRFDAAIMDAVKSLQQSSDAHARAVGNSLEAVHRVAVVPKSISLG